ncbi:MAG: TlpA disulfide reductase family protein [Burkholderiaceae bacterium]
MRPFDGMPPLRTLDGARLDPRSWRGVPTIVVFWATWCEFCRRHNPRIDALYRTADASRLRIIGVAIDGPLDKVRRHVAEAGYRFPVVVDDGRLRPRFSNRRVVPTTCIVETDGRLRQCIPGEMSDEDVRELGRLALPAPPREGGPRRAPS